MIRTHLSLITFLLVGLYSCKKGDTGAAGATGPSGPSFTGAISGHVAIYDQYGSRVNTGLNDVQLTLKGGRTLYCDTNGYFIFDSVVTDNYSIAASGASLASTMLYNVPFVKDTTYEEVKMSMFPTFNLTGMNALHNPAVAAHQVVISYTMDTRARNCIVFADKNPGVSNLPGHHTLVYVKAMPANSSSINFQVPVQDLNQAGIFYGDIVYYAAYSYVVNDASVYDDANTGQTIYNAVGLPVTDTAACP